ncbi:hypothetical protein AB0M35_08040 [Micromonospora sp. NPDC051196]|uniref:hypothetical protein n=1 Tax=Micromonospora sp. NPDC051196 TaxID=3155281 RepID=UPI00341B57BD
MTDVELDVFSGRPNPRWTLSATQRAHLIDQLRAGSVPLLSAAAGESRLGYRGFVLRFDPEELRLLGVPATTNRDNSGNIIVAPVTANRGNYNTGGRLVWGAGDMVSVR